MKSLHLPAQPSQVDCLFVLLLLALSGNLAFTSDPQQEPLLVLMFLVAFLRMVKSRRGIETKTFLVVFLSYVTILFFQAILLPYLSFITIIGFLTKLIIGAAIISTVRCFRLAYVRVMTWLAVMSLLFHVPTLIAAIAGIRLYELVRPIANLIGAHEEGTIERVNVLVHTFTSSEGIFRNAGMFWEPGAFSGYLLLALVFLATIQSDLPSRLVKKWRAILIVTELTTLSTSGYLILPFALFLFAVAATEKRGDVMNRFMWLVLFLMLLVPTVSFAWQLDFIGQKIDELLTRAINQDAGWQLSRFGAAIFDWTHIQERPVFGWSPTHPEVYSLFPMLESYSTGNGMSGYTREMGFAGLMVFLASFWIGLGRIGVNRWSRVVAFFIVVFQLNGQSFLTYPLYLGLHFIGLERMTPSRMLNRSDRLR